MIPNFLYFFFHNETREVNRSKVGVKIPSWEEIEYKKYSIFPQKSLLAVDGDVWRLLKKRKSNSNFRENVINLINISYILKCAYGLQFSEKEGNLRKDNRTVPSAGKRYPIELYFFLFKSIKDFRAGVYHYNVRTHAVEPVLYKDFTYSERMLLSPEACVQQSNGFFCLTSVFGRTIEKYGDRGYRYILLEAGHIGQNILIAGSELNLSLIPVGGNNESQIEECIGLNSSAEKVVYTIFF